MKSNELSVVCGKHESLRPQAAKFNFLREKLLQRKKLSLHRTDTQYVENMSCGILTEPDDFGWVLTFI